MHPGRSRVQPQRVLAGDVEDEVVAGGQLGQQVGAGHREPADRAAGQRELLDRAEDRHDTGVRDAQRPEAGVGAALAVDGRGEEGLVQPPRVGDTQRDVPRGVGETRCMCKHVSQHRGWDIKSKGGRPYEWDVVLAVAHGTRDPAGVETVSQIVDALRRSAPSLEVRAAFIELAEPDVPTALAGIPADRRAVLVPLLLASGYHDRVDLPAAIAAARPGTAHAPVLGPDPRLAVALADRLREAGRRPGEAVVLAAAGSSDPAAVASVRTQAALLAAELGTAVTVGFGSAAAPDVPAAVAAARRPERTGWRSRRTCSRPATSPTGSPPPAPTSWPRRWARIPR